MSVHQGRRLGVLAKVKTLALGYLGGFFGDSYLWLFFWKNLQILEVGRNIATSNLPPSVE
jgi:hypothetical protein